MSISHRLWDDSVFLHPGEHLPPPAFSGQLLWLLGVEDLPFIYRLSAVQLWLCEHVPSPQLRRSLDRRGYYAPILSMPSADSLCLRHGEQCPGHRV
ncbi:hypothetical protein SEA_PUPPER_234 [Gordonia phage Pupper]|uniref:Uncharacterized protein n=1 Tax=Gordonia phage Pupper TaxID=2571249 RepID=A0A4Y6EJ12_9CAUD|nr:hypothetical protein KHQ83_gp043 [Gordonia phage Pupper]QDF18720.1 hypothetical protein SEA_PUPPER_234 [Gordonia phage Pupper]